jgi:uncharacterized protein YcbK (DUF882 family)
VRIALFALLCLSRVVHAEAPEHTAVLLDANDEGMDKKARWLADKAGRTGVRAQKVATVAEHPLSLQNMWTDEILPLSWSVPDAAAQETFSQLVRCHYTQVATHMAPPLLRVVRQAARTFKVSVVELVSGFRAPKYQLMLRKKGHEVARDSAHPKGEAVDFRLPTIPTKALLSFVRKQKLGGVGYYPVSQFVHADVGKIRFWKGH